MKPLTFSYMPTKIAMVGSAVIVSFAMLMIVVFGLNPNQPTKGDFGATQYPASLSSLASGCGDIFVFEPEIKQYGEIPKDIAEVKNNVNIPIHTMLIPVFGYMSPTPLRDDQIRFYEMNELEEPLPRSQILRTMYEKDTDVIWYSPDIPQDEYLGLKSYVATKKNVLAVKWQYGSNLPVNRAIAFSSWGISQSCEFWTETTFESFQVFADENRVTRPNKIPVAVPMSNGVLPPIDRNTKN